MLAVTSSAVFLLLVGVVLPALAAAGYRRLRAGEPLPPRRLLYVQSIVTLAAVGALATATAAVRDIPLFPRPEGRPAALLAGLLLLALALGSVPLRWRHQSGARRRRLLALVPRGGSERALWVVVCLFAGVWEEIIYRGVLFTLLERAAGGAWVAALVAALLFGLAHMVQGPKSAALVVLFALGFQGLVLLSGDLYVAMAVHFVYDLAAGILYGRMGRAPDATAEAAGRAAGEPSGPAPAVTPPSID